MKFISTLAVYGSLLASSVSASPVYNNETVEIELEERSGGTFPIVGIHTGKIYPRMEIRTMEAEHPYMFNLLLLALAKFKAMPQSERISYYQISGIHGVPNIPWDGVGENPKSAHDNPPPVGYCTHNSNLFPAWHRPYVALYEQAFWQVAQEVAREFKGKKRTMYMEIAKTIRWPYWDWAINPGNGQNNFPTSVVDPTVNLDTPSGRKTISNPLYYYDFHPFDSSEFIEGPWNAWHHTLRQPNSKSPNAHTQPVLLLQTCNKERPNLQSLVYYMFTHSQPWDDFANAHTNGYNSIEAIHNIVHGMVGGGGATTAAGHMTVLWYAAFDPVFWLHHAQVDRLFALWQRTHPDIWVTPQAASQATFSINTGEVMGANSPLKPFHRNTHGTFWTPNAIRGWEEFGYTYPEFQYTDGSAGAIRKVINEKYGPHASEHAKKRDLISTLTGPLESSNGSYYEYIANIATGHNSLNGSYGVYIFLGDPPSDVSDWTTADNLVGSNFVFAAPGASSMGDSVVTGSVSLTQALANQVGIAGGLENLGLDLVVPFLQGALQWRIAQGGAEIQPSQVPGFQVSVTSSELTPAASDTDFPTWGTPTVLLNVTDGKPGAIPKSEVHKLLSGIQGIGNEIAGELGSIISHF